MNINEVIANELKVKLWQVEATVKLLDEGATVPFIARYRKEVTGSLTDDDLRTLEERLHYLHELEDRRQTILKSIQEQGKLTDKLKQDILAADNKARLEDLYLPYKPKRRTKAQIAIEAGLEPLADLLLSQPESEPEVAAKDFINEKKEVKTIQDALDGARQILMERMSEQADLLEFLRNTAWEVSILQSEVIEEKKNEGQKFTDYFEYQEPVHKIPSHRALAVLRGRKEGVLRLKIEIPEQFVNEMLNKVAKTFSIEQKSRPADAWLWQCVEWAWKFKLKVKLDVDVMLKLKESAETIAIDVFKDNLKNLLMTAPAGNHVVMGLDPGLRTGVKVVVCDSTGKLLEHTTIFPHAPQNKWDASIHVLAQMCQTHQVKLISIGNGTASRETDKLVKDLKNKHPELNLTSIVVSEAGASVYSASKVAAEEFPDLDVSFRGAVSIARRLQDPLAELVKIEPKSIGVGQYQHDVNQIKLDKSLHNVLEDCVNAVGADVNTASVPLLKSISGLNETVAQNIIKYREENGRFANRSDLKNVPRLGDKTYEQAVGFLRIINGENPLDASSVHPEAYPLVESMLKDKGFQIESIIGNEAQIDTIKAQDYVSDAFGLPTIRDVLSELKKPGRDPRPEFKTAAFVEGINDIADVKPDMILEGVVTNVTNFGAFVDIGVHQDGLVHISQLANKYIKDPHEVVKVGDIVKTRVIDVDVKRKRIQLSMNTSKEGGVTPAAKKSQGHQPQNNRRKPKQALQTSGFGDALQQALKQSQT